MAASSNQSDSVNSRKQNGGLSFPLQAWKDGKKDPWTPGQIQKSFDDKLKTAELMERIAAGAHLRRK